MNETHAEEYYRQMADLLMKELLANELQEIGGVDNDSERLY